MSGRKKDDLKLIPLDDLKKVVGGLVAVPKHKVEKATTKPKKRADAKKR
jgi:hypothetical protein